MFDMLAMFGFLPFIIAWPPILSSAGIAMRKIESAFSNVEAKRADTVYHPATPCQASLSRFCRI